jgi:gamma-glutamylcyclotransferase
MLYFAYGFNMQTAHMRAHCPGCVLVGRAILRDHRLTFSRWWTAWGGGGVADIQPAPGEVVEGVVWEISPVHREALDRFEEYPTSYTRKDVTVETPDSRTLSAFAYVAHPEGCYRPARRYLRQIVVGAREQGLSAAYVAFLAAIPTEG